ncbi:MAG TPA: AI-2E family transporter [Methylomirabilota bacterium]|jgi:predicted PurR-regulated permease PerM|nr:AI-2E family transporter [Methylomirabilota bacterium]
MIGGRLPWPLVFQVLGVAAAVWLFLATWPVWLLVFTALIIAAAILPAARIGERYHVPRGVTVLVVYLLAAGIMTLMGRLLWPALSEQWTQFMDQLPRLIDNVRGWVGDVQGLLRRWGGSVSAPKPDDLGSVAGSVLSNTLRLTAGTVGIVFEFLAILVIAAYLIIDARHVGRTLLALLPPSARPAALRLTPTVMNRIGGYVRGQILSSLCVGVLIAIALTLLGVRYSLLIGAMAAVFNIVPFVGATLAAVLAVLSALNESATLAALTLAAMIGAQTVEGKLLAPHFVGRATGLHPLAVLLALLAGAHMAGLIGALVAVPLLAGLWEIIRALYVEPQRPA